MNPDVPPPASTKAVSAAAMPIFCFTEAITNIPFVNIDVVDVVAVFRRADATIDDAKPAGAACAAWPESAVRSTAVGTTTPRFWKTSLSFSIARESRIFAAASVVPSAPTDFPVEVGDYTSSQWKTIDNIAYSSNCGTRAPGVNGTAGVSG